MDNFNPQRAVEWLADEAENIALARAQRLHLEDYSKSLKSILMKEHPSLGVSAQEREALADPRYLKHLEALKIAIENDEKMRYLARAAETKIAAWQTMEATKRTLRV